jgi:hypothetical protein
MKSIIAITLAALIGCTTPEASMPDAGDICLGSVLGDEPRDRCLDAGPEPSPELAVTCKSRCSAAVFCDGVDEAACWDACLDDLAGYAAEELEDLASCYGSRQTDCEIECRLYPCGREGERCCDAAPHCWEGLACAPGEDGGLCIAEEVPR